MEGPSDRYVMQANLIAPCGMNCALCSAYQRDKKRCHGCNRPDEGMPVSCTKCIIRNCKTIAENDSKLCYECDSFPCRRLKALDKRYSTKYSMSMIDNLTRIKEGGMDSFIEEQRERWDCKECGNPICVHKGHCMDCNNK
jgi:hypothetical protein